MTVFDNIAYPLRVRHAPRQLIQERVGHTLELLGLSGLEGRPATQLSGGQQQRVALARALVFEPRILLLDEPLSNLDARLRVHMRSELKHLQQATGITSIFVTHDQAESMALADRIVVMNRGRIEQIGSPADIYEHPRSRFVNDFVGSMNAIQGVVADIDGPRITLQCGEHQVRGHVRTELRLVRGDAATATMRPESLSIGAEPAAISTNQWVARVLSAVYYGDHREYQVEIADQPVTLTTPASVNVARGAQVIVTCDPSEVVVIADSLA
jgi:iron(III) transport system ATP-binding protein